VLVFVMHQVIATWFVFYVAPAAVALLATWVQPFGWTITSHQSSWIQTPYHPVQIGLALFLVSRPI